MEKPILIVDAPRLSDEGIESVQDFLNELMIAFKSHYYHQLRRQSRISCREQNFDVLSEDEDPF